jgi:hypothetical protein
VESGAILLLSEQSRAGGVSGAASQGAAQLGRYGAPACFACFC